MLYRGRSHGGLRMRKKLRKILIPGLLIDYQKCLNLLDKTIRSPNGLAIMFRIAY